MVLKKYTRASAHGDEKHRRSLSHAHLHQSRQSRTDGRRGRPRALRSDCGIAPNIIAFEEVGRSCKSDDGPLFWFAIASAIVPDQLEIDRCTRARFHRYPRRSVVPRHPVLCGIPVLRRDPREGSFAEGTAGRSADRELWPLPDMGALVRCSSCHLDGSQFSFRAMAAAKTFRGDPRARHLCKFGAVGRFKYLPEVAVHFPVSSLQQLLPSRAALGAFVLDVPGDELSLRSLSRRGVGPNIFRICVCTWLSSRSRSRARSVVCPICCRNSGRRNSQPQTIYGAGLARIATGVFMMQVAKLLGQGIFGGDGITGGFDRSHQWSGADVWCLALGYGLQLFFDFAGYSHIAIGAAQAMGFTVPENFARPFASTNASVFWTRWHMSLSFWIRDYLFLPLATVRREIWWRNLALVIAMVVFGLWHKASVLFLLWGCYHGVLLVLHRQVQQAQRRFDWDPPAKFWTPISWIATMALISLGWIFFRANSLPQARQMYRSCCFAHELRSHVLSGSLYFLVAAVAVAMRSSCWSRTRWTGIQMNCRPPNPSPIRASSD